MIESAKVWADETIAQIAKVQAALDTLHGRDIDVKINQAGEAAGAAAAAAAKDVEDLARANRDGAAAADAAEAAALGKAAADREASKAARDAALSEEEFLKSLISVERMATLRMEADSLLVRSSDAVRNAQEGVAAATRLSAEDMRDAVQAVRDFDAGLRPAAALAQEAADRINAAGAAMEVSGGRAFRRWWTFGQQISKVLHWIATLAVEFLAVAIPATLALGAALGVMANGAVSVALHLKSVWQAASATQAMFGTTASQAIGLKGTFEQVAQAVRPDVFAVLGGMVNLANERMGVLAANGQRVAQIFDAFMAKLVFDFSKNGPFGGGGRLADVMVPDLVKFGQAFGNAGHAIMEFAAKAPGVAEMLLGLVVGITKLVVAVSSLPRPIIYAALAFHEFNMWGSAAVALLGRFGLRAEALSGGFNSLGRTVGILSNVFKALPMLMAAGISNLGSLMSGFGRLEGRVGQAGMAIRNFGADMTDAIVAIPAWQAALAALAVAGIGYLIYRVITAKTAMQNFTDSLQNNINKASNIQALGMLAVSIGAVNDRLAHTPQLLRNVGTAVHTGIMPVNREFIQGRQALSSYEQQVRNVTQGANYLAHTYRTSLVGALVLADQAHVKLVKGIMGTSAAAIQARFQIANLVQGYKSMGQPVGAIGTSMTAMAIQAGLAQSQVLKLNQAWDQFMSNLVGGTSGLAGFEGSLANLGTGIATAKNNLSKFAGDFSLSTRQFAQSLNSFTGKGSQAWQNFNQVVGSTAPQLIDWLRTAGAEGAISGNQFQRAILEMTAQLVPFASKSAAAKAEVLGLVQQAGLGIHTWAGLTSAIKNGHLSMKDLQNIISGTTQKMANMSAVAKQLGTVLSSQIASAVSQAEIKASGLTDNLNKLATSIQHGITSGRQFNTQIADTVRSLARDHQSIGTVITVLNSMGLKIASGAGERQSLIKALESIGLSAKQATKLVDSLGLAVKNLHSKKISVTTEFINIGHAPTGIFGSNSSMAIGRGHSLTGQAGHTASPRGPMLVGELGPEMVFMPGGARVVPHNETASVLAALAGADAAGNSGHAGTAEIHVHAHLDSKEVFKSVQTQSLKWQTRNAGQRSGLSIPGTKVGGI